MSVQFIILLAWFLGLMIGTAGSLYSVSSEKPDKLSISVGLGWTLIGLALIGVGGFSLLIWFSDPVELAQAGFSKWRIGSAWAAGLILMNTALYERFGMFKNNWGRWLLWGIVALNTVMIAHWVLYGPNPFYLS
jgi:hypothetical protein